MAPITVKWIMLGIIILAYIFDTYLVILNLKHHSPQVPDEFKDVYDADTYAKNQQYKKVNATFALIKTSYTTLLIILMLIFNGFAIVNNWVVAITPSPIWQSLLFFGIIMFGLDLLTLPFQLYDTFVIEEKFGFNKTTIKTFFSDKLKQWLIIALIGGALLYIITLIYYKTETYFWLMTWAVIVVFQIFISLFYTDLIVPLFNKLTPLEEGSLREKIQQYAQKTGYDLSDIYKIDSSRRSTKLNAYFTGWGKKKKIVLYDTLMEKLTDDEIVGVLAHEVGHYKHKHVLKTMLVSIVVTGIYLYLFQIFSTSDTVAQALGVAKTNFHIALIAFGILFSPIDFILSIFTNIASRKHEYQADEYAAQTADSETFISALKKLSVENLSNLTPHPLFVFFEYSHPPLLERIEHVRQAAGH